jgi:hypothetical protein
MVLGVLKFMACIKSDNTAAVCSKLVSVLGKGWKIKIDKEIALYKYINKYCTGSDYYSLLENFIEESNLNIKGVLSDYITSYFNIPDFLKVSSVEELILKLELMSIGPDEKC